MNDVFLSKNRFTGPEVLLSPINRADLIYNLYLGHRVLVHYSSSFRSLLHYSSKKGSLLSEIMQNLLMTWVCLLLCSFHTYDYARHFESSCIRILGLEGTPEGVENDGKVTRVSAVRLTFIIQSV